MALHFSPPACQQLTRITIKYCLKLNAMTFYTDHFRIFFAHLFHSACPSSILWSSSVCLWLSSSSFQELSFKNSRNQYWLLQFYYYCISETSGPQDRNNVNMLDGHGTESKFLKQKKYFVKSSIFNWIKSKSIVLCILRENNDFHLNINFRAFGWENQQTAPWTYFLLSCARLTCLSRIPA